MSDEVAPADREAAFEAWIMERPNHGRRWRKTDWLAGYDASAARVAELERVGRNLTGALNFIMAFYEPNQRYLDTEAWKNAEAGGRHALAEGKALFWPATHWASTLGEGEDHVR